MEHTVRVLPPVHRQGWRGISPLMMPSWPGPQTLLSCHQWRSKASSSHPSSGSWGPKQVWSCGPQPMETAVAIRLWGQRWGRGLLLSRPGPGWLVAMEWVLEPCRTQPSAYSLGPPAHPRVQGWMNWRAWWRPRTTSYLTLHLTTTAPLLSESPH